MSQKHSEATFIPDPLCLVVGKPIINASTLKRLHNICNLSEAPFVPEIHVCSFLGAHFSFLLSLEQYFKLLHGDYFKHICDFNNLQSVQRALHICMYCIVFSGVIF